MLRVVKDRAEQQRALRPRHQPDNALDGGFAYQRRRVMQVGIGQFQGVRAGVVGQFGVQAGAADVGQVRAGQLLVQHTGSAGLAIMCLLQGLSVTVIEVGRGDSGRRAHPEPQAGGNDGGRQAEQQVAMGL